MFHIARVRLTLWYTAIISVVMIMMSAIIYENTISAIQRNYVAIEERINNMQDTGLNNGPVRRALVQNPQLLKEQYEAVRDIILLRIILVNSGVIVCVAILSYIFAGRTLEPIEASHAAQKRFVSDASHELRTPLTSLMLSIEVALRSKKLSLARARDILKSNYEDLHNLHNLIEQLLALASTSKNIKKEFVKIAVKDSLSKAIKHTKPLAKEKNITIEKAMTESFTKGNETMLYDTFVILLDNAIKYTPEKGTIRTTMTQSRTKVRVAIQDTGIGIPKDDIPHIFDRFYRVDTARTSGQKQGFGIGLSLAQKIVNLHDGSIAVESKQGHGSTFTVTLPRC
ncbi:HAMP domain-containing histidine kinase [Candidatus Woesebacteria bacterium]|nr:HAMP domain-containing histidine kinase [Candidatus Woesebacteria bacterium]